MHLYVRMYMYAYVCILLYSDKQYENKFSACKTIPTMVYLLAVRKPFIENEELLAVFFLIYRLTRNRH